MSLKQFELDLEKNASQSTMQPNADLKSRTSKKRFVNMYDTISKGMEDDA